MPPMQATAYTLDEDNNLATATTITDVERVLEDSPFSVKELRVCTSSTAVEGVQEGVSRYGADVMVYCGLGSKHYDVSALTHRLFVFESE